MAKNIDFMGAIFPDVPSVKLPQQGGGLVAFDDTTDATATADKILQGYTAYANGQKLVGTASGGITPSGTISITSNGTYDVTQYASADVNVSGGGASLKPIVLRPDAELVSKYTYDKLIVEDEGIALPAYSTSNKTLKTSALLGRINNPNFTLYDYYYIYRALAYPIYSSNTKYAGKQEYSSIALCGELDYIQPRTISSLDGTTQLSSSRYGMRLSNNNYELYWSSATSMSTYDSLTYGAALGVSTVTTQGSLININSPALNLRGHTTYFNQTAWNETIDIRYQYVIELYRAEKGASNCDGWHVNPCAMHVINCANSADHTLT